MRDCLMKPVITGVIGCGAISDIYLSNMIGKYATLDVVACAAAHRENAEKKAAKYGIRACSVEELLSDPTIELIVVLTPAPTHYGLVKQALLAGKHVYTEKPISTELSHARELLALAEEKGLRLGAAPETFMGSALQTGRRALDDGLVGEVTSFHVVANRDLNFLASLFRFLRGPGGGICYDYGVYYLTALISLLGPIDSVFARVGNHLPVRKNCFPASPEFGQDFVYDNEAQVNALLTLKSGVVGNFSLNGDSAMEDQAYFTVQGTGGILQLCDANAFGGAVRFLKDEPGNEAWRTLEPVSALSDNCRGLGPAQMALCIREGGAHLVSKEMACHVLDVIEKIMESGRSGRMVSTETACDRPAPLTDWQRLLL